MRVCSRVSVQLNPKPYTLRPTRRMRRAAQTCEPIAAR